jgi:hypothetical protein
MYTPAENDPFHGADTGHAVALRIVPDEESNSLELLVIYQLVPDW